MEHDDVSMFSDVVIKSDEGEDEDEDEYEYEIWLKVFSRLLKI